MRAFAIETFGEPGSIREVPDPEAGEGEVVVAVQVAGMNQTDIAVMAGYMKDYMEHRFPLVIGIDASGIVERVGPGVEHYRAGDEVYGYVRKPVMGEGTMAERVVLPVGGLTHKPRTITWEEAAVVGHSALTAAAAVDDVALTSGQRLVLLGGTAGSAVMLRSSRRSGASRSSPRPRPGRHGVRPVDGRGRSNRLTTRPAIPRGS